MPIGRDDSYTGPRPQHAHARPESRTSRRVDEQLERLAAMLQKIDRHVRDFELAQSNAMTELKTRLGYSDKEQALLRDRLDGAEAAQREQVAHDRRVMYKLLLASIGGGASVAGASQILQALGGG